MPTHGSPMLVNCTFQKLTDKGVWAFPHLDACSGTPGLALFVRASGRVQCGHR